MMRIRWFHPLFGLVAGLAVLCPRHARAQFDELAKRIPPSANALVLMNAEKIYESPVAIRGNWQNKVAEARRAGLTLLPPQAKQAIFAAEFDFDFGAPLWQVMLGTWKHIPTVEAIAKRTHGTNDNIGGIAAVRLPQDAYVLRYSSDTIGFMNPGNRQLVTRWARDSERIKGPVLSRYLSDAYDYANSLGTPLVMALDLGDVITEAGTRAKLQDLWKEYEFEGKAKIDDVVPIIAGIRGVTLGVTFKNEPHGALRVDFERDAAPLAGIAKDLTLAALHERGVFINEFENWELSMHGKHFRLDGKLTDSGLRRLMSVFDAPPSLNEAEEDNSQKDPKQKEIQKTLEYFHTLQDLFKDLKNEPNRQGNHYTVGSMMGWYESYARKIDNLPILGVDPALVDFGTQMAKALRQAAYAIKTGGVQAKTAQMNAPKQYNTVTGGAVYGYSYRSSWYGEGMVPYGSTFTAYREDAAAEQQQASRIRTQYRNQSIFSARQIVDSIEVALADVRRELTKKYQVEF